MGAEQLPVHGKLVHGIIAADAEGARPVRRGLLQESGYGLVVGAGASYAILVMMTASIVVGLVGGLSFQSSLTAMIQGGSKMFWMFFMFVLFEPFLNYVSASGAFDAVCQLMQPLIDVGGEVAFLMLSAAVGIFGISGTGVAQAQIIHELLSLIHI